MLFVWFCARVILWSLANSGTSKAKNNVQARRKKILDAYAGDEWTECHCVNWFAKFRYGAFVSHSEKPVGSDKETAEWQFMTSLRV